VRAGAPSALLFCLENNVQLEWGSLGIHIGKNESVEIAGEVMNPFPL